MHQCIECGLPATERHHVIPKSFGGNTTVWLCGGCHAKVHGMNAQRRDSHSFLIKIGKYRASESRKCELAYLLVYLGLYGEPRYRKDWPSALAKEFALDEFHTPKLLAVRKHLAFWDEVVDKDAHELLASLYDVDDQTLAELKECFIDALSLAGLWPE
jgi:hypothetical protein